MPSVNTGLYQPIWKSITIPAQSLGAFIDQEVVLSPHAELGDEDIQQIRFSIPQFQRGLRWSEKRRQDFLLSMSKGLPIGTLVLGRQPGVSNESEPREWKVLDGQQRIATINVLVRTYWERKRFLHSLNDLRDDMTRLGQQLNSNLSAEEAHQWIYNGIEALLSAPSQERPEARLLSESSILLRRICTELRIDFPSADVEEDALLLTTRIRSKLTHDFDKLREYPVPVLLVTPSRQQSPTEQSKTLTEVFTALNKQQPLTTYEIVAASWSTHLVQWPPSEGGNQSVNQWLFDCMATRIMNSYQQNEDFDFDPNVAEFSQDSVSLYDFLYALGNLADKANIRKDRRSGNSFTFDSRRVFVRGDDKAGESAFDVLGLFGQGQKPPDLDELPNLMPRGDLHKVVVQEVIDAFQDAANCIQDALQKFAPDGNIVNRRPMFLIQSVTYMAMHMAISRSRDFSLQSHVEVENEHPMPTSEAIRRFKRHLPAWWLLDSMSGEFVGSSGNTNAVNRVWDVFNSEARRPSLAMTNAPNLASLFASFVDVFCDDSRAPQEVVRRSRQDDISRAVMFAAFVGESASQRVDVDHVIPHNPRREGYPPLQQPLPLNHIANFMPVEYTVNRSRGNRQWSDYVHEVPAAHRPGIRRRLMIPEDRFGRESLSSPLSFLEVMLERYLVIVDRCLINVGLEEYSREDVHARRTRLDENIRKPIIKALREELYTGSATEIADEFAFRALGLIAD